MITSRQLALELFNAVRGAFSPLPPHERRDYEHVFNRSEYAVTTSRLSEGWTEPKGTFGLTEPPPHERRNIMTETIIIEKKPYTVPADGRVFLRIKLASLVAEAAIIRKRERKAKDPLRAELHNHRVLSVRRAARETGIALGLIRGLSYSEIEPHTKPRNKGGAGEPDWVAIGKMLAKYGGKYGRGLSTTAPFNGTHS